MFEGRLRRGSLGFVSNTHRASAAEEARDYSAGQQIDVYVDERRPDRSTLTPGLNWGYLMFVLFGALFFVIFFWQFLSKM